MKELILLLVNELIKRYNADSFKVFDIETVRSRQLVEQTCVLLTLLIAIKTTVLRETMGIIFHRTVLHYFFNISDKSLDFYTRANLLLMHMSCSYKKEYMAGLPLKDKVTSELVLVFDYNFDLDRSDIIRCKPIDDPYAEYFERNKSDLSYITIFPPFE